MRTDRPPADPAPVLVLGLGNPLLHDDGVGLELLRRLEAIFAGEPEVEFLDGGTQGIALVGALSGRRAVLMLDALALGSPPGKVHLLTDPRGHAGGRGIGAHEANAGELLAASALLDQLPEAVNLVGVEVAEVKTGIGLSEPVREAVPEAVEVARWVLVSFLAGGESAPPE